MISSVETEAREKPRYEAARGQTVQVMVLPEDFPKSAAAVRSSAGRPFAGRGAAGHRRGAALRRIASIAGDRGRIGLPVLRWGRSTVDPRRRRGRLAGRLQAKSRYPAEAARRPGGRGVARRPPHRRPARRAAGHGGLLGFGRWCSAVLLQNYSPGGFCVQSGRPGKPGEKIHLRLDNAANSLIVARIQWQTRVEGKYVLGCALLSGKDFERLRDTCRDASLASSDHSRRPKQSDLCQA